MLADVEGTRLVKLARNAVATYFEGKEPEIEESQTPLPMAGTFVTIYSLDMNARESLRGCVGFPVPSKSLMQSIVDSALAAGFEDPRFPPLQRDELGRIIFEVSILTPPVEIRGEPSNRASKIKLGSDGLILKWRYGSGLLLPQVPIEHNWTVDEYLLNICGKAGAPLDEWMKLSSKLYTFQAIVFKESEPGGKAQRLAL